MNRKQKLKLLFCGLMIAFTSSTIFASGNTDVMSDGSKWSWGENIGWMNWNSTHSGVTVSTGYLSGYIWCENIGWVHLGTAPANGVSYSNTSASDYGINRDQGTGRLSGYAWGENVGWINFNPTHGGVSISTSGIFGSTGAFVLNGWAWGENIGWICFSSATYRVRTYALPPPPTNLTGTPHISSITWTWTDNSSGWAQEDGFRIFNATSSEVIGVVGQNVTQWQWSGLQSGVQYSIYVQPYNVVWSSSASNSNIASCTITIAPSAPSINLIRALSDAVIQWNWSDPNSGASQEQGYKLYTSTGGLVGTVGADTTYYTEAGLQKNREYARYVQAYNAAGSSNSATVVWRTKPGTFQSKVSQGNPVRTGNNSFGFFGDANWTWQVPVKSGSPLTITCYVRYNTQYGGSATKPKITLSGRGISTTSVLASAAAENAWELLSINAGTPTQNGILLLIAEGFSNNPGARFWVDDIQVSQ